MAYATLAELRAYVGIPLADTADDVGLQLALDAAAAQVDGYCDRVFSIDATVTTRYYSPVAGGSLDVDPIATLTGLIVATDEDGNGTYETAWTINTDFRADPPNAVATNRPWTRLIGLGTKRFPTSPYRPTVSVTAKFGWPLGVAPAPIKAAVLIQASRLWKRKDAPFGVAGSVEFGSEVRLLAKLDPDVELLLRPYRRQWWVL